ncbi:hypothetical protein [Streptomyces sp. NPDC026673]|uniref:hypothetical protein n=1 Tax=Streptomyces sp. NPDC026673 TaxID=3155724 RepID=UPI0033C73377
MTVTTDALLPALEDVRKAHTAVVDRFRADMAVTPAGPHRQALERHAAQTQSHITRIGDHVRGIRPRRLLRDTGDMVQTASADAVRVALLPVNAGARMVRAVLPGRPPTGEHQVLRNTEDEYTATARALAACRAGESIAGLAQDEKAAALLSVLRRQDEELLRTLESCIEEQALAVAAAAGENHDGGLARTAAHAVAGAVDRVRHAAWTGGRRTAHSAAEAVRGMPPVSWMAERVQHAAPREQKLPLPSYDRLAVPEIIERLRELSQVELSVIEDHERAHGDRVGILNAIENLRGDEPWPGYDRMNSDQITARLRNADALLARQAMDYEKRHLQRPAVVSAAKQRVRVAV